MTERDSRERYIKCSRCKMKYLNNDENINQDFGYNRLNERYKTCVKCRNRETMFYPFNDSVKQSVKMFLEQDVCLPAIVHGN